jgi:hypothetical protein
MPDKRNQTLQSLPVANYSPSIARAIEWLGDRYLLAKPINAALSRVVEVPPISMGLRQRDELA